MPRVILTLLCLFCYLLSLGQDPDYVLVWSDEFDQDGEVNDDKWFHQTIIPNGVSWFNNEEQHYTDRTDNSIVESGNLRIIAKRETFTDQSITRSYTSARLNSKFAFTYGRVDVRAKLPAELGTWPAIWTLGKNISENGAYWQTQGFGTTTWPVTGEIDIMEQFGRSSIEKNDIHGSTHTPRSNGATENTASTTVSTSTTGFHVYSIIWDENEIQFLVDDTEYYTYNPVERYGAKITDPTRSDMNWPFDEAQYLILNVAMGGVLGGTIPESFDDAEMEIDYVRVYQESTSIPPTFAAPVPAEESALVVSIYSDSYEDIPNIDFESEGGATVEEIDFSGNMALSYSLAAEAEGNFQTIDVGESNKIDLEATGMSNFQFDVWFSETINSNTELRIKVVNKGASESEAVIAINSSSTPAISDGRWISYDFTIEELSNLGLQGLNDIQQLVIDVDECGTAYLDNIYFYRDSPLSTSLTPAINIYPNPSSDYITIQFDDVLANDLVDLTIHDALGRRVVAPVQSTNESMIIDVRNVDWGIYFLSINTEAGSISRRFI